jgi:predicted secreted protein
VILDHQPPAHVVSEADNGSAVRLLRGETLSVVLEERPTTGFRWQVVRTPPCCQVRQDDFEAPSRAAPPGAAGKRTWRIEATKAGSGPFEVRLQPIPGRSGREIGRTFTVELTASD